MPDARLKRRRRALQAQGLYYFATGIAPIVSPNGFQLVTGPKKEMWMAKTMGGLIAAVGGALVAGTRETEPRGDTTALAVAGALVLGASDVIYASKGRIAPVYFLDGLAQAACLVALARAGRVNA